MEKTSYGCPFEIVGLFTDNPNAKCVQTAKALALRVVALDIREYYKIRDKPLKDRSVREEFDKEALNLIEPFKADAILLAGYVWATTDNLLNRYLMINVHPADLSIQQKDGTRVYAGANGVDKALNAGEPNLASTAHLATKQIDGGPILVISEKVPVDYSLHQDDETRMRHYLKLVNDQNRITGARAILEVALGNFSSDLMGNIYYKGERAPNGIRINSWGEDRPLFERNLDCFLNARSIAVIGASNKHSLGRSVVKNLLSGDFQGQVYAINIRGETVMQAKGYKSIGDIPEEVEMAVITVPSSAVLSVVEQCGQKGVKVLVCITAGFQEVGEQGVAAERELSRIVSRYNMRMIGPNCMGILSVSNKLNATMLATEVTMGNVALVTQSGAIGAAMLDSAKQLGIGFSLILSLGNQMDVNASDVLQLLATDDSTDVILLYLESIKDPGRFMDIASKINKPIILLKSGKSIFGANAAKSHTGSLAEYDSVVNSFIEKAGILRMDNLEQCFIAASALSKMPSLKGNRVGVLTNAGGPGILISDELAAAGFRMPLMQQKQQTLLSNQLFKEASTRNPIDVMAAADPKHYAIAAQTMLDSRKYDGIIMCCVPPATIDTADVAKAFAPVAKSSEIPIVSCFFGPTIGEGGRTVMHEMGVPAFDYPEHTVSAMKSLIKPEKFPLRYIAGVSTEKIDKAKEIVNCAFAGEYLPMNKASDLLACYGIRTPGSTLINNNHVVSDIDLNYPLVAKIDHSEIVHKSDVGGVRLGISDKAELQTVIDEFMSRFPGANGVFVQEMLPRGLELIVGSVRDPILGSAVMVGLGGTQVEVFRDVVFGLPPISSQQAKSMIHRLQCFPLLEGYRGKEGVNLQALEALIMKLGDMLLDLPSITELDLNPVIYSPRDGEFIAADVRIKIGELPND